MYAVVKDRSRCLTLEPGQEIWIDRIPDAEPGSTHTFDQVHLLKREDGSVDVGTPAVSGASVVVEVLGEAQDEKLYVQHFRRRKNSRKRFGHRQRHTHVRVREING